MAASFPPGPLVIDLQGPVMTAVEREALMHPLIGGVVLFRRNWYEAAGFEALVRELRQLRPGLLLTVDQEGGRVQRFVDGFSRLPAAASFGRRFDEDRAAGIASARAVGWLMASELRAVDVDMSFAPVLDLGVNQAVIGDRALHREPRAVTELATAWIDGAAEGGMASCGKHFPGHGTVGGDSHQSLPVDGRAMQEIESQDLQPFSTLINVGLPAVMSAHVRYPTVDELPASLSGRWMRDILRNRLGFDGALISDDLSMVGAAAIGGLQDRIEAALDVGSDLLLICNAQAETIALLDCLSWRGSSEHRRRIAALLGRATNTDNDYRRVALDFCRRQTWTEERGVG